MGELWRVERYAQERDESLREIWNGEREKRF